MWVGFGESGESWGVIWGCGSGGEKKEVQSSGVLVRVYSGAGDETPFKKLCSVPRGREAEPTLLN